MEIVYSCNTLTKVVTFNKWRRVVSVTRITGTSWLIVPPITTVGGTFLSQLIEIKGDHEFSFSQAIQENSPLISPLLPLLNIPLVNVQIRVRGDPCVRLSPST